MKKAAAIALSAVILFTGCDFTHFIPGVTPPISDVTTDVSTTATEPPPTTVEETTPPPMTEPLPVYGETEIGEVSYDPAECSEVYEAENASLTGYAKTASFREGYSGSGYVSGISLPDSTMTVQLKIKAPQHYNITVCAASDSPVEGVLYVDGLARGKLSISGNGKFEAVKYENIYLTPDEAVLSIQELSGECDIDFVLLESSSSVYQHDYSVSGRLSNIASSERTIKTYKYLCEMYGEAVLSGQQCSQGTNAEIDAVARVTGRYPAIRFGELMGYSEGLDTGDIELAIDYAKQGGLVGYVWNWMQNGSCYLEKSGFKLKNAVTTHEIAKLSADKLTELKTSGGISGECLEIVKGIDLVAAQLKRLADENIPVIFRPLPEAGNGEFWWSADKESYLWLYKLIYTRLTSYHMLNNIIWVWNANEPDWYVGDEYCDIISLDVYDYSHGAWDNQSHINALLRISGLSADKPVAISECNVLPGPANIVKDDAYWLYASVWSGNYALNDDSTLSEAYISRAEWIMFYNCSEVLARDELVKIE